MIGFVSSFIECIPNANYYLKRKRARDRARHSFTNVFQSKNIAEVKRRSRQSGIGGADLRPPQTRRQDPGLVRFWKFPAPDYSCNGLEEWGKKYGVKVTSILHSDPVSPDYSSLILQFLATGDDAIMGIYGTDDTGAADPRCRGTTAATARRR